MRTAIHGVLIATALIVLSAPAQADTYTFVLDSHPGGSENPPPYGLRLDGLDGDTTTEWTWDFGHASSNVRLVYDDVAMTIRIYGDAYGGEDVGTSYAADSTTGVWELDFTYSVNVSELEDNGFDGTGDDRLEVTGDSALNAGTIIDPNGDSYNLTDYQGSHSYSFRFNNTADHRLSGTGLSGPDVYVGWGWLNHSGSSTHVYASDWLFIARPIPEPGTLMLLGLGLGCVALRRRRQTAS